MFLYLITSDFKVHGSVHRKNILIYIQQDANLYGLFYLETALRVSQITVSTASGTCHTVTAIWRHCGRVGTGLSVLWVVLSGAIVEELEPV
jgi:hypothetical protein